MKKIARALILALGLFGAAAMALAEEPVKAVYDLMEGREQASRALQNVRNHLDADPTVKIVVIGHGAGIDFMLENALDVNGRPYAGYISELANRGVVFRVCRVTLEARGLKADAIALEASTVPSGVAEVARLQSRENYAYLRP